MAVLAVVRILNIFPDTSTTFGVDLSFASLPDGTGLSGATSATGISPASVEADVAAVVQTYLESQSVVFGVGDVVQVI